MNTPTHEFVTVDLRGLKAGLVARARAERASVSVVVRRAVENELGRAEAAHEPGSAERAAVPADLMVKLSIRLTSAEAEQLAAGARRAGLSRGAFLADLVSNIPSLADARASRPEYLAALTASSAELSTLSRNLHQLAAVLRQGDVPAAREYRRKLEALGDEVRTHLRLAAGALAEVRPVRAVRAHPAMQRATS
jgi:hypothetical protein